MTTNYVLFDPIRLNALKNYYFNVLYNIFVFIFTCSKFCLALHTKLFKNSILKTCTKKKRKCWLFVGSNSRHLDEFES